MALLRRFLEFNFRDMLPGNDDKTDKSTGHIHCDIFRLRVRFDLFVIGVCRSIPDG